jgi:hypothetical protein
LLFFCVVELIQVYVEELYDLYNAIPMLIYGLLLYNFLQYIDHLSQNPMLVREEVDGKAHVESLCRIGIIVFALVRVIRRISRGYYFDAES